MRSAPASSRVTATTRNPFASPPLQDRECVLRDLGELGMEPGMLYFVKKYLRSAVEPSCPPYLPRYVAEKVLPRDRG